MNTQPVFAGLRLWIDTFAPRLVRRAAKRTPVSLSERLKEEWLAHLSSQGGTVSRLQFAFGCCWAAIEIGRDDFPVKAPVRSPSSVESPMTAYGYARIRAPRALRPTAPTPNSTAVCDINTTPLIDVMLVLLVTLIMSLPLMTHAVKIDLPQGPPLASEQPEMISLDIESDGTVVWDGTPIAGFEQLDGYFRAEARKTPQPEVHLRPERRVRYEVVAKVLALAQHDRIQKIGFVDTGAYKD